MVKKWDLKKKRHTDYFAIFCNGLVHHMGIENWKKSCSILKTNMKVWIQSSGLWAAGIEEMRKRDRFFFSHLGEIHMNMNISTSSATVVNAAWQFRWNGLMLVIFLSNSKKIVVIFGTKLLQKNKKIKSGLSCPFTTWRL